MLKFKNRFIWVFILALPWLNSSVRAEDELKNSLEDSTAALDRIVERITANEKALAEKLRELRPVIETYIQNQARDEKMGSVPNNDEYFLGKLEVTDEVNGVPLLPGRGLLSGILEFFTESFSMRYLPEGFAAMVLVDESSFDRQRYDFKFIRREFLGEVRCLVFDVKPLEGADAGFSGRIWVEDRDYNVVRFNGVNRTPPGRFGRSYFFHLDSWRLNIGPGLWLPAYVYTEESDLGYGFPKLQKVRFKGQTRIWGYDLGRAGRQEEFTAVLVDSPAVNDRSDVEQHMSPVSSLRQWQRQAEDNVLERLEKAGLLAPEGEVDQALQTVLQNLEITNQLEISPELRCRILLTAPLGRATNLLVDFEGFFFLGTKSDCII